MEAGAFGAGDEALEIVQLPDVTFLRAPMLAERLGVTTTWMQVVGEPGAGIVEVRSLVDGLVGSGVMRFDAPGETGSASVRYIDEGAPVVIEPPPAADVTDVTEAIRALVGRETGGWTDGEHS
jgi:hypothetical protein